MNDTLLKKIYAKTELNDIERESLVSLLGKGCRIATWNKLRFSLSHIESLPTYGILDRVIFQNNSASYTAGQSYPDEIRTVRKIIIERK